MKKLLALFLCLSFSFGVFALITFSDPDLNVNNELLFTASYEGLWHGSYKALFQASLNEQAVPKILTCYPETITPIEDGMVLEIKNWYGTARYSRKTQTLSWIETISVFNNAAPIPQDQQAPVLVSPDGKWSVRLQRTSVALADLIVSNIDTQEHYLLSRNCKYSLTEVPAAWSPDSGILIYENQGNLYFLNPRFLSTKNLLEEPFRKIGPGTIASICWASPASLFYICGRTIYSLSVNELYTRSLYADLVGVGKRLIDLPCQFDSHRDRFWINYDASAAIINLHNESLLHCDLTDRTVSNSCIKLPETVLSVVVFWPKDQIPLIWVEYVSGRDKKNMVWTYAKLSNPDNVVYAKKLSVPSGATQAVMSPDNKLLSFTSPAGLHIYDIKTWMQLNIFSDEKIVSFAWADEASVYVGGTDTVRLWKPLAGLSEVLFLSCPQDFAWDAASNAILARSNNQMFQYKTATNTWQETSLLITRLHTPQNAKWRVFLDSSLYGYYTNTIYARALEGASYSRPLFLEPQKAVVKNAVKPRLSLVFNAIDSADGLARILTVLQKYQITATFFINGEFMRRYPSQVRDIALNGHQCGSLFFTNFNIRRPEFLIDSDFIARGLARNEDDFFALTGRDLSLLWHTPDYISNDAIRAAGNSAGYTYIDRSIDPSDWVTLETAAKYPGLYHDSTEIVENLARRLSPGIIIPLVTGIGDGTRVDYVYENLDVLIDAIIRAGYDIVPVTEL